MNYDVYLSSSVRQNLLSIQKTTDQSSINQTRLTTGKSVNSALDDPVKYFTSQGLTDRSSSLTSLLTGMSNGIQTVQAASKGIDTITDYVKQLQSVVQQAQNNIAENLPTTSSNALVKASETATVGGSAHDVAINKTVLGTAADAKTTTNGNLGLKSSIMGTGAQANTAISQATIQIKAGNSTYSFAVGASDKVSDVVAQINKSGVATASVDSQGKVQVTGVGSDPLSIAFGAVSTTGTTAGTFAADKAGTTTLFGAAAATSGNTPIAGSGGSSAARSSLVSQFNTLRDQIDDTAKDASFSGVNLLNGDKATIVFNEKTGADQSKLDIQGTQVNSSKLGIGMMQDSAKSASGSDFSIQNDSDLRKASDALTNALSALKSQSSTLSSNQSIVQTRQDFTKNLTNILDTGAGNLTNADMNQEAANSQALQLRQSLGTSALSMANQANQDVLQLLR
ncbi:flagellin [Methylobacterium sp. 1030]|uniref:flagellin N-terminal helical domain-containing protein n=1 Tax=Methylobacterium sp. 1030 TaxID=3156404 RepID=UPI003394005B